MKLADGLWVYVDIVTHFISDPNLSGSTSQLKLVVNLTKESCGKLWKNPLVRMNMFYNPIMFQIPPKVVSMVWKILLLYCVALWSSFHLANVLGLFWEEFYSSCRFIQSVLSLTPVEDPEQLKDFCIYGYIMQKLH